MKKSTLLLLDALINLVLGVLLLWFPSSLVEFLGLPHAEMAFYPNLLGAVLFGIGIALLIQRFGIAEGYQGLGLEGAIAINVCGGAALAFWLIFGDLTLTNFGSIFLWLLVILLLGISLLEFVSSRKIPTE